MAQYRKQHILPRTYLKHFSKNGDGKDIYVIDFENPFNQKTQQLNSGDRVFWIENYSDSLLFDDKKAVEKMFATKIEPLYNEFIITLESESLDVTFQERENFIKWILYSKLRSTIWNSENNPKGHIEVFLDDSLFYGFAKKYSQEFVVKKWKILKSPNGRFWLTSDNPGFWIDLNKKIKGEFVPDPFGFYGGANTIFYYPLTKKMCFCLSPYEKNDPIELNASNDKINFIVAEDAEFNMINKFTFLCKNRLLISSEPDSLKFFEDLFTGGMFE
jgi:hypothetical protein